MVHFSTSDENFRKKLLYGCKISVLQPYFGRGSGVPCIGRGGGQKSPPGLTLPFSV